MNKKAFTLIEIVAVIIVLGIISLIAFPIMNSTIKNSKERAYNSQINEIITKAKEWGVKNVDLLPDDDKIYKLRIKTLIEEGFLKDAKNGFLKNPIDGSNIEGCVMIKLSNEYNQYIYEYSKTCD